MAEWSIDVTQQYRKAAEAAQMFSPGKQPDIAELMKAAFIHGYAQALLDHPESLLRKPLPHAPTGCYCTTRCMAPTIQGRQMPCRDPNRFAPNPDSKP